MSMTLDRACKIIKAQKNAFLDEYIDCGGYAEAYDIAIEAIKNLAPIKPKSRKLEFVNTTINPDKTVDKEVSYMTNYYCGNCGMDTRKDRNYCAFCGKKIDWEKVDD